jgi:hypothetical protein
LPDPSITEQSRDISLPDEPLIDIKDLHFAYDEWEVLKARHATRHAVYATPILATLERVFAGGGVA